MKKIITITIVSALLFITVVSNISAHMMDTNGSSESDTETHENLETYLPVFLKEYDVENVNDVDCSKVMDSDFERLGDALMETNHPGVAHEAMDEMMGGEGSESLEQMHINMGRNYLGCNDENSYNGMMNGSGMMENTDIMGKGNLGINMMNSYFGSYRTGNLIWDINGILITVLLLILIRYFWKKPPIPVLKGSVKKKP